MSQAIDIFELSVDVIFRCCGWVLPEQYFTFELDIMVGTIIKMIGFVYSFTFLDIYSFGVLLVYFYFWCCQASFVISEQHYIFQGKSNTKKRKYYVKFLCITQSLFAFPIYIYMNANNDTQHFSTYWIIFYIICVFAIIDILELIIFYVRDKMHRIKNENYECVGFSYQFLKFRMIGGIIGIIALLIVYIIFLVKVGYENQFSKYLPCFMIFSEILDLVRIRCQINKKRRKEKLIVDDRALKKLKFKKWYCIIMGFNYGLVGVITSCLLQVLYILLTLYICICCSFCWQVGCECLKKSYTWIRFQEIIDYELQDLSQLQEDQLNPTTQI